MSSKPPEKPRVGRLTGMEDVLQALLQNSKSELAHGFQRWRLEKEWPKVVGESIAAQTVPCSFEKGTLYIWVRHSAWMQQLWFFQEPIMKKINEYVGYRWVRSVRFTLEKRAATNTPDSKPEPSSNR